MPMKFSRGIKLYLNGKEMPIEVKFTANPHLPVEVGVMAAEAALAQACDDKEFCRRRGGLARLKGELLEARRWLKRSTPSPSDE